MSEFMLAGSDPRLLLSHAALIGLGAILEETGARVLLGWRGGMGSKPVLDVDDWSANEIGAAVRAHAERATQGWPTETLADAKGRARGLMSPRLASLTMSDGWRVLEDGRRRVADTSSELDLRLLGALGRPAYWRIRDGRPAQDEGASRWEMQPRNQGSEFVGTRLLPLARAVAARTDDAVVAGLVGDRPVDELGGGRADSRTATGLAAPGPVDSTVAWCAFWGLSQFPVALKVHDVAASTGHIGRMGAGWFHTLTWRGRWRPARVRTMLAARAGRIVARRHVLTDPDVTVAVDALADDAARHWLATRGVTAVVCFPVTRHGSDSAPERRAGLADVVRLSPS